MSLTKENYANIDKLLEELMNPPSYSRVVEKDDSICKNVNVQVCAKCGGACCKKCGCHFSPEDFEEISFEFLKKELEKGYISIDSVPGETIYQLLDVYILRARNQGASVVDLGYRRSPCILLTDTGCKLDYSHRPAGGRLLIPVVEFHHDPESMTKKCKSTYNIKDCCYEWLPYQGILRRLIQYFDGKEIPCSI